MKKLLFIFFLIVASLAIKAQSATFYYDATNDMSIQGGDSNTAKIVSSQWTIVGTPPSVVQFTNPNSKILNATVTKDGTYTFQLTIKDNLGNIATGTLTGIAYAKQVLILDLKVTKITSQIK